MVKKSLILLVVLVCGMVVSLGVNIFVLNEIQGLRQSYERLYEIYLSLAIQPPISKPHAVDIALKYGGWNETTLKTLEVTATLYHLKFYNETTDGTTYGFEVLHQVTEPVWDYSPVRTSPDEVYRYVWMVRVTEEIPPPIERPYLVDAATGEVIS